MDVSRAVICERWNIPLGTESQGWFLDWALREPHQVSRHLTAGFRAYLSLQSLYGPGELRTVQEYFGGLGAQSLFIQDGLYPQAHTVIDYSSDAVAHLRRVLAGRRVNVQHADSYAAQSHCPADLVGLDFGDLTAWRLRPGQPQRMLLDRVMADEPKAVVLTDVAGPRLHLHRERYGEFLQVRPERLYDYPSYLYALDDWLRAHYGYRMLRGYWHRWSAVLALVPAVRQAGEGALLPVPDEPRGLELR